MKKNNKKIDIKLTKKEIIKLTALTTSFLAPLIVAGLLLNKKLELENVLAVETAKIGDKLNDYYIYINSDFPKIYYVETVDQINNEATTYFVKKQKASNLAEYNKEENKTMSYGEKYIAGFYEKLNKKASGDIYLYLNVENDELISIEYRDENDKKITLINTIKQEKSLYDCLLENDVIVEALTSDDLLELKEKIDQNPKGKVFVK